MKAFPVAVCSSANIARNNADDRYRHRTKKTTRPIRDFRGIELKGQVAHLPVAVFVVAPSTEARLRQLSAVAAQAGRRTSGSSTCPSRRVGMAFPGRQRFRHPPTLVRWRQEALRCMPRWELRRHRKGARSGGCACLLPPHREPPSGCPSKSGRIAVRQPTGLLPTRHSLVAAECPTARAAQSRAIAEVGNRPPAISAKSLPHERPVSTARRWLEQQSPMPSAYALGLSCA